MPLIRDITRPWIVTRTRDYDWRDFVFECHRYRETQRGVAESATRRVERLYESGTTGEALITAESYAARQRTAKKLLDSVYNKIQAAPADMVISNALRSLDLTRHEQGLMHQYFLYFHLEWRLDFDWYHPAMRRGKHEIRQYIRSRYYGQYQETDG